MFSGDVLKLFGSFFELSLACFFGTSFVSGRDLFLVFGMDISIDCCTVSYVLWIGPTPTLSSTNRSKLSHQKTVGAHEGGEFG